MLGNDFLTRSPRSESSPQVQNAYNFFITLEDKTSLISAGKVIKIKEEDKVDSSRLFDHQGEERNQSEELYIKQLSRVIRLMFFISLKVLEVHYEY